MMTPWGAIGVGAAAALKGWRDRERDVQAKDERDREFVLRKREADTREEVTRRAINKDQADVLAQGIDPSEEHYAGIFGAPAPIDHQFPDVNNNGIDDRLEAQQGQPQAPPQPTGGQSVQGFVGPIAPKAPVSAPGGPVDAAGASKTMEARGGVAPSKDAVINMPSTGNAGPSPDAMQKTGAAQGAQQVGPLSADSWYKTQADRMWSVGNKILARRNEELSKVVGDDDAAAMKRAAIMQRYSPMLKSTLDAYDSTLKQANDARLLKLRGQMADIAMTSASGDELIQKAGPILQALGIPPQTFQGAVRTKDAQGQDGWKLANGQFRPLSEMAAVIDQTKAMDLLAAKAQQEDEARKFSQKEKEIKLTGDQHVRAAAASQAAAFGFQQKAMERDAKAMADATGHKPGSPEYQDAYKASLGILAAKLPATAAVGGGVDMKRVKLYSDLSSEAAKIASNSMNDEKDRLDALAIVAEKAKTLGLPTPFKIVRDPKTGKMTGIEQPDINESPEAFRQAGFVNPFQPAKKKTDLSAPSAKAAALY